MRYYLVTRENSTQEDTFQIKSDRTTGIVFIQPIAEKFSMGMINKVLNSMSVDFKLNNSDKTSLDSHGITLVFQYPKNQIWLYDIEHPDNNFLKSILRDSRIQDLIS